MKSFLDSFLTAAPDVLSRAFGAAVEFAPTRSLPAVESFIAFELTADGDAAASLQIFVDRAALLAAFAASGSLPKQENGGLSERWAATLRAVGSSIPAVSAVECTEIAAEMPNTSFRAYEMDIGSAKIWMAFFDLAEHFAEAAKASVPVAEPHRPAERNFDLFLDIELEASLRFGSRELPLREVLDLGPGDVVELDRNVTDPVDLVIGDKIVARGEVVLVNGNFGLRVTEVAEPRGRLESIRCLF
jgi:flagellar motor switch protein FliN/FliY